MSVIVSYTSPSLDASIDAELCRRVRERRSDSFLAVVPTKRRIRELQRRLILCAPHAVAPSSHLYTLSLFARTLYDAACAPKKGVQGPVQAVIVEEAITHLAGSLHYFFPRATSRLPHGTFRKIIEVLNNMKEKGLYPEQFEQELALAESDERVKLEDISLIYSEYERRLSDYGYIDAGGIYRELNAHFTPENAGTIFRNRFPDVDTLFVEGFSELAPPERQMLETLTAVPGLAMIVHFDYRPDNSEVFGNLADDVDAFRARGSGPVAVRQSMPEGEEDFKAFVAHHLFTRHRIARKFDARDRVHIIEAPDRRAEAQLIARTVKRYLLEHPKTDPGKICVATYDTAQYTALFREIFRSYGIPVNITDRFQLASSPVIVSMLAMLDVARNNFRQKDVLRALASPYCAFARDAAGRSSIDAANLYTVAKRLKITAGRTAWHRHIESRQAFLRASLEETADPLEQEDLARESDLLAKADSDIRTLEHLLRPFETKMAPTQFKRNLLELIDSMEVASMILNGDRRTLPENQRELETRAFGKFLRLIDDVLELLEFQGKGKRKESLGFYLDQLKTAVGQVRFNVRQRQGYGVYVTSIEETRGLEFDVMLIGGLVDGEFPALYQPEIFLSKYRRRSEERHEREYKNLFYQGITNFSEALYLFHPRKDGDAELVQSIFIDALEKIADVRKWQAEEIGQLLDAIYSETDLHAAFGLRHSGRPDRTGNFPPPQASTEIEATLAHIDHGVEVEQSRTELHVKPEYEGIIGSVLADADGKSLDSMRSRIFSVSQLETYGKCPFQYFANRILRLNVIEKIEEELTPIERGSVLHEILFDFFVARRSAGKPPLAGCSDDDYEEAIREMQLIAGRALDALLISDAFWDFEKESILGYGTQRRGVLKAFIDTERASTLTTTPAYFEVAFGGKTGTKRKTDPELGSDTPLQVGRVQMRGKIDRIEIGQSEFCIVDYKTGNQLATRKDIDDGISLQLPIYLHAVEEMLQRKTGRAYAPAAGVYYKLRQPVERKLGLGNKEYNKKAFSAGTTSNQLVENEAELRSVIANVVETVNAYVDRMTGGEFPLTTPEKIDTVCKHCDYKKICRIQTARHVGEANADKEK